MSDKKALLCRLRLHRWRSVSQAVRGISLYEYERCLRCDAKRTVWNGGQMIQEGWRR